MAKGPQIEGKADEGRARLPTPALPKGGGAIRGIGETFSVSAASGTASLSVPISTSPGRGGFQPDLHLTYDSGSGNGPFGLGFSLSIPSIARKTERGLPRYRDAEGSDVFVLSGAEDLVPALRKTASGAFERDEGDDGDDHFIRHRPRVEGDFARIERRTRRDTGETYWRVVTRDNVTHTYGRSETARLADPGDPRRVFRWMLEESRDDKGNVIRYVYAKEDRVNVPRTLSERNRNPANTLIKRVFYGNVRPPPPLSAPIADVVPEDYHFEVVFDYGEHTGDAPEPTVTWPARADAFSSYRAGFEVREYRLCRRVLMFHRFPGELLTPALLVRSTELVYHHRAGGDVDDPAPGRHVISYLRSIRHVGHDRASHRALPPLDLTYVDLPLDLDARRALPVQTVDAASLANAPHGVGGGSHRFLDLDGEGLPGILIEEGDTFYYKRNLGEGRFGPLERVAPRPTGSGEITDLDGDGLKYLVRHDRPAPGFSQRTKDGGFTPFTAFPRLPTISFQDPNLRFVDLDGDGLADVLVTEDGVLRFYRSLGRDGFAPAERVFVPPDEERGPRVVFADRTETVFLADLSGDGLPDLVRVRHDEVCYWPNLGHGHFGGKIAMENAPVLDRPERFDPARVRLADIDGSGTADLLYLGAGGVRFWFNLAGNAFGPEQRLPDFPIVDRLASADVIDLLGRGTACLVWSSPLRGEAGAPLRFVDLMSGVKPHLLARVDNNLSASTTLEYAPSTTFYLADRAAGRPWVTRLPFVVHVVAKTVTEDAVTGTRLARTYAYHHGHYDGIEREFRGFAFVEEDDAEGFTTPGTGSEDLFSPPSRIRTWFHTGAYFEGETLSARLASGYYGADRALLEDTIWPQGLVPRLAPDEAREAARALRGRMLRQEVFGFDRAGRLVKVPFQVVEHSYALDRIQPRADLRFSVFAAHPRETLTVHYEQRADDPRIEHEAALEVDRFGFVRRAVKIGYPRRAPVAPGQEALLVTCTESDYFHAPDDAAYHRLGVPIETRAYQITNLPATPVPLSFADLAAIPSGGGPSARLVAHEYHLYYDDLLTGPLARGDVAPRALPYESYRLAFTSAIVSDAYRELPGLGFAVPFAEVDSAGYLADPASGQWWIKSGRLVFDPAQFFQPVALVDPFGRTSRITYDDHALLVVRAENALLEAVVAENDYRTLAPRLVTDPNGNRRAARFDPLGFVVAAAVMGKEGSSEGDSLDPVELATTRVEYDFDRFRLLGLPNLVRVLEREQHGAGSRVQETITYADGLGREVQKKKNAEPGEAHFVDASGALASRHANPRWVGSGRTVFDNKGNPVRKYEPFFSTTSEYEAEDQLARWGVADLLEHDPLGRAIRITHPNGSFSRVIFDAWGQATYDENDTLLEAGNGWYADRIGLADTEPDRIALERTRPHAGTPAQVHTDALGRTVQTAADDGSGTPVTTTMTLDIVGNVIAITDARVVEIATHRFDLAGRQIQSHSVDAGDRFVVPDVAGKPLYQWNGNRFRIERVYDELERPTHVWVDPRAGGRILAERTIYGDRLTGPARSLVGKPYRVFDGSGLVESLEFDFKGNLTHATRRLTTEFRATADWSAAAGLGASDALPQGVEDRLENEAFETRWQYDALNRAEHVITHDGSDTHTIYNEAGLLERVVVTRGAQQVPHVQSVDYNEKGQRKTLLFANGVTTTYDYEETTFRLRSIVTTRAGGAILQSLAYTYDPVGNVVLMRDLTPAGVAYENPLDGTARYRYDALYRLIEATGREHLGQTVPDQRLSPNPGTVRHPNDASQMREYTELYQYDAVGNIEKLIHQIEGRTRWTRDYTYDFGNDRTNRLTSTSLDGGASATYGHDDDGNMTWMPGLEAMDWDFADRLQRAAVNAEQNTYFTYDTGGQRVRKRVETRQRTYERIYLGGLEIFRELGPDGVTRETLHVMAGDERIALVETRTAGDDGTPARVTRYQHGNHLGSSLLELGEAAEVISYEEYHPYGTTAYHATGEGIEVSAKRYRYTGKERDEETGLAYHGARYYAPWLGRWTSADPAGMVDGPNVYAYVAQNPAGFLDPTGLKGKAATPKKEREIRPPRTVELTPVQPTMLVGGDPGSGGPERIIDSRRSPALRTIPLLAPGQEWGPALGVTPQSIQDKDKKFDGPGGKAIHRMIAEAARKVDINPGLLAASMFGETSSMLMYTFGPQDAYTLGIDDYKENEAMIHALVPASREIVTVGDWLQPSDRRGRDGKPDPRMIRNTTIPEDKLALAHASYLKFHEEKARAQFTRRGIDFDALPPEHRFAFTRLSMNPGHAGIASHVDTFIAGRDVIVPTGSSDQNRNHLFRSATIHAARAIHLSQKFFNVDPRP